MFETAILVLLYNCELSDSKTLQTLKGSNVFFKSTKLVIWNNGPKELSSLDISFLSSCNLDITIKQTIENQSLAFIYNQFLEGNKANRYILLDHDSTLNSHYLTESLQLQKGHLGVPKILSYGKIRSPTINGIVYNENTELSKNDKVISIGSGLVISKEIAITLKEKYGQVFDQRFYLYGVDTTFFYRVFNSRLISKIKIINGFEHSLSRLEVESDKVKAFRRLERTYDLGISLRYYYSWPKIVYFVFKFTFTHLKNRILKKNTSLYYKHFIKAIVTGTHYRSNKHK